MRFRSLVPLSPDCCAVALMLGLMVAAPDQVNAAAAAPRVPLGQREDYQAALRASQLNMHDVAALKFERLLKEKDLNRAEEARVSGRLVDALLRARLPEKAQVALTLFNVPEAGYWRAQILLMQRKYKEAETELRGYLKQGGELF